MAGKIFISYKRDDDPGMAGRLADALKDIYSGKQVFYDTEDIPPGVKFQEYIESNIIDSSVLLVVIGAKWLELHKKPGEKDFVIFEVTTAQKYNVPIIPVLLQNTPIPPADQLAAELKFLPDIQTFTIRHVSFGSDVDRLSESVDVLRKRKSKPSPIRLKVPAIGLACLVILAAFFWWFKQKSDANNSYRKIVPITSKGTIIVMDWSSGYIAGLEEDHPACILLGANTILTVNDNNDRNEHCFYYGIKEKIPESLHFRVSGNKLYINQELKAISIAGTEPIDTLTNDEIRNLETISLMRDSIGMDWYNQLAGYIQINQQISVIPHYVLDPNNPKDIGNQAFNLMHPTTPEILVCGTSFWELGAMNLGLVKSAIVHGAPTTATHFYQQLAALPRLKNIVSQEAEAAKILLGDSVESISVFDDTTLNDISMIKNKDKIKQLQLIDNFNKGSRPAPIDFNKLASFKNLKSFGYYNPDESTARKFFINLFPLHGVTDLTVSNIKIGDLAGIAERNPGLQNLTVFPYDRITNLNWAANFSHLKSLSLYVDSYEVFTDTANSSALSKLKELKYLGIGTNGNRHLDRTSIEYQNLMSACPSCNIYAWGICLGSGWLLLFFPAFGVFLLFKALSRTNHPKPGKPQTEAA
jgi:hypothetical protein